MTISVCMRLPQTIRTIKTTVNSLRPLSSPCTSNSTFTPRRYRLYCTARMGSQPEKENERVDLRPEEVIGDLGFTPMIKVADPWTVDKVVKEIPGGAPTEESSSPLPFFHMLERLKTTKREGWRRFGISRGESIADHMYRMSLISMFAPPSLAPKLDLPKCMKMCLIHDMAELLVGDITPVDGVPKPEKSRREAETMDFLTKNLLRNVAGGTTGEDIRAIWQEYEDSETLDSHFVHDVDKMELLLQMVEYEKRGEGKVDLGEFAYVATRMTLPEMKAWGQEVLKEREAFWGSKEHVHGEQGVNGGVTSERKGQQDNYYNKD
ncbi:HD domain-containing protein [Fusarium oxysporum II5]|nr:hydrolase-HD superfamily protein [Fusarium odoratissimum NRRL 54006]EXM04825.1 hydrolase-HD superfamily protein [Fusarium odoratissimum NRRL 54006]KAK2126861.1 HD domain-containing protein [Fusarium oxysporum II5]